MIVPDANLLLYAYDASSPFHEKASKWWTRLLNDRQTVALLPVVAMSFVRLATHPKVFEQPLSVAEVEEILDSWVERANVSIVETKSVDLPRALKWLKQAGTGGNLTTDAWIAAVSIRIGATVHTADSDFGRFPEVSWTNPLVSA